MTAKSFREFCALLVGDWVGHRVSTSSEQEAVRSEWQLALGGNFLQEHWHTAGSGPTLQLTAEAFFRVSESGPGDFVGVYRSGKIAFGESTFDDSQWILTHRWLREPGIATIRLRFLDDDTYEQDVAELSPDGVSTPESHALMKRDRATRAAGARPGSSD